ncbi:MAG: hypothetical protein PVI01_12355, partial [Gemmatimonadales bacterium]
MRSRFCTVLVLVLILPEAGLPATRASFQEQEASARRDSARLYIDAGLALAAVGDTASALAELRRAVASAPDHAEAHFQLGCLLAAHAGSDSLSAERHAAEASLLEAVALDPDNSLYLITLVRLRGERRMTPEGKRVIDDLLRPGRATRLLDPDSIILVDTARVWVREFERLRARNFPRGRTRYRCDERIGGTCLSYVEKSLAALREPLA